jgi:TonB family protein
MCQYGGVVVINIAVNQEGKVLSVKLDEESSKTNDACLIDAALKSAKRTRFNRKKSASKVQLGSITYKFIEQ